MEQSRIAVSHVLTWICRIVVVVVVVVVFIVVVVLCIYDCFTA